MFTFLNSILRNDSSSSQSSPRHISVGQMMMLHLAPLLVKDAKSSHDIL